jgi:hypothetical protein
MAEHVSLKADLYEKTYKNLARALPDEQWRTMLEGAQLELDRPLEDFTSGPLVPELGGQRQLDAPDSATPVFLACLAECTTERHVSELSPRFWTELMRASYGDLTGLWQRLGGEGAPGYRTYRGLLGTLGLGGGTVAPGPWWLGDIRHRTGAFTSATTAGLLSPAGLRALVKSARAHALLGTVKAFFEEQCPDPEAAPKIIEEHERLLAFLERAFLRGDWVLGRE